MGVDIGLWVEYKNEKGEWVDAPSQTTICYYCNGTEKRYDENSKKYSIYCTECDSGTKEIFCYYRRNYAIFGILADVKTFPNIKPISDWRGVPEDYKLHPEYEEYKKKERSIFFDGYGSRYNASSYLSLKELKEYDWNIVFEKYKWLEDEEFYKYLMPALDTLAKKYGGDDNVRVVFSFDY